MNNVQRSHDQKLYFCDICINR